MPCFSQALQFSVILSADIGTHWAVQTLQGLAQVEELGYLEAKWVLAALTGAETVIQVGQSLHSQHKVLQTVGNASKMLPRIQ